MEADDESDSDLTNAPGTSSITSSSWEPLGHLLLRFLLQGGRNSLAKLAAVVIKAAKHAWKLVVPLLARPLWSPQAALAAVGHCLSSHISMAIWPSIYKHLSYLIRHIMNVQCSACVNDELEGSAVKASVRGSALASLLFGMIR